MNDKEKAVLKQCSVAFKEGFHQGAGKPTADAVDGPMLCIALGKMNLCDLGATELERIRLLGIRANHFVQRNPGWELCGNFYDKDECGNLVMVCGTRQRAKTAATNLPRDGFF